VADFARPVNELMRGIGSALPHPGTTRVGSAGQGFPLDEKGMVPTTTLSSDTPTARMYYAGTAQVTTNNSETGVALDSVRYDTHGMAVTGGAGSSYFECKLAGKYLVHGEIEFATDADGSRKLWIAVNNTSSRYSQDERPGHATKSTKLCTTALLDLAVNDKVYLMCLQDSGGNLQINKEAQQTPEFWALRVAA